MSDKSETEIITPEAIQMQATLDTEAILAVGLSQAEEFAETEMERCRKESEAAAAESASLRCKYHEEGNKLAAAHLKKEAEAVKATLATLGIKDADVAFRFQQLDDGVRYTLTVSGGKSNKKSDTAASLKKWVIVKEPAALKKLNDEWTEQDRIKVDRDAEAMQFKKRLAKMPQLERKLRGRLAAKKLENTAEGQAIVSALTDDIQAEVLKLPCR